jgi:hypothetical protein
MFLYNSALNMESKRKNISGIYAGKESTKAEVKMTAIETIIT